MKSVLFLIMLLLSNVLLLNALDDFDDHTNSAPYQAITHCYYKMVHPDDNNEKTVWHICGAKQPYYAIAKVTSNRDDGIDVIHKTETFPGGVFFGLFASSNHDKLYTVAHTLFAAFNQQEMHNQFDKSCRALERYVEETMQAFDREQTKKMRHRRVPDSKIK